MARTTHETLVHRLRRVGCVFAEEEAEILEDLAPDPQTLEAWSARRETGELLEQVVGRVELCGEMLAVGPGCFVPRQRTALLIRAALAETRARHRPLMVEACCGVAPIATTVGRRLPATQLHVTDQDPRPLVHARRNLPPGARVHRGCTLDGLPAELLGAVDVLAAVPPYVPSGAWALLPRDPRQSEPSTALVSGEDGLGETRRLLATAPPWLAPSAVLLLEMHRGQAPAALAAARGGGEYAEAGIIEGEDGETVLLRVTTAPSRR